MIGQNHQKSNTDRKEYLMKIIHKIKNLVIQYSKLIPLILYPFAYLFFILVYIIVALVFPSLGSGEIFDKIMYGIAVIYNICILCFCIYHSVSIVNKKVPVSDAAWMNLIIKGFQIPAYIFHFLMGLLGGVMGIWGIGFLLVALAVSVLSILLTGISAIGCGIRMKQEGILTFWKALLMSIGSFIFCVDLIIAIVYVVLCKKHDLAYAESTVK